MKSTVRALNAEGTRRFCEWIGHGGAGAAPFQLLQDVDCSVSLQDAGEVEPVPFSSRYALGLHIEGALSRIPLQSISRSHGVWTWLTLFYFDHLCPPSGDGKRRLGELVRYVWSTDFKKYYRHLIGFAVEAIRSYGKDAEPLLVSTKPGILHTDYCEQIFGYQDLCQNREFLALANRLYFDWQNHRVKRGAVPNEPKPGTLRRLGDVFDQLQLTYDVQGMSADALAGLLPAEFGRWLKS